MPPCLLSLERRTFQIGQAARAFRAGRRRWHQFQFGRCLRLRGRGFGFLDHQGVQPGDDALGGLPLGGRQFAARLTVEIDPDAAAGERDLVGSAVTVVREHAPALGRQ